MRKLLVILPAMLLTVAPLSGQTLPASTASDSIAAAPRPAAPPSPCESLPEARRFDFWEGEWEVYTADGRPAGRSSVRRVAGGCGLQEWWTASNGATGTSLNAYNPLEGQWQQFWVGQFGVITEYRRSQWLPDGTLVYHGTVRRRGDSTTAAMRMSFTPLADGVVRQLFEESSDGGEVWNVMTDLRYRRVKP